jgi:VanZ family protein
MRFSLIISILITLFIWMNSLLPADVSSAQSGFIVGIVDDILSFVGIHSDVNTLHLIIRKFAHFFEFFVLGISLSVYMIKEEKKIYHVIWIGLVIAIIDETIQLFVDGRTSSLVDVGIDTLGTIFGICLVMFYSKITHQNC